MNAYRLTILVSDRTVYDAPVHTLTVPGIDGLLTVLAGHAPMTVLLKAGNITVRTAQETLNGLIGTGFLKVTGHEAALLVRSFDWMDTPNKAADESMEAADDNRTMF